MRSIQIISALAVVILSATAVSAQGRPGANTGNSFIDPRQFGAATGNSRVNPYFYQNVPGTGYYRPNPYYPGFTFVGPPVPVVVPGGGAYFSFRSGNTNMNFWKSPSGYYYPWYAGGYRYVPQILVFQQGDTNPQPAQPPVITVVSDMRKFMDEAKNSGQLTDGDYTSLSRRLNDLMGKYYSLKNAAGGTLDEGQESDIRRDFDQLGSELASRMKP